MKALPTIALLSAATAAILAKPAFAKRLGVRGLEAEDPFPFEDGSSMSTSMSMKVEWSSIVAPTEEGPRPSLSGSKSSKGPPGAKSSKAGLPSAKSSKATGGGGGYGAYNPVTVIANFEVPEVWGIAGITTIPGEESKGPVLLVSLQTGSRWIVGSPLQNGFLAIREDTTSCVAACSSVPAKYKFPIVWNDIFYIDTEKVGQGFENTFSFGSGESIDDLENRLNGKSVAVICLNKGISLYDEIACEDVRN